MTTTLTARDHIVAILSRRFPCQALPIGALTEVADEVGVTREYVRQIANVSGWGGRIYKGQTQHPCEMCGQPASYNSKTCSRVCGSLLGGVNNRRPNAIVNDEWAFRPEPRECPMCNLTFTWTPEAQKWRARNIASGNIAHVAAAPCCSMRCAIRQGVKLRDARRQAAVS